MEEVRGEAHDAGKLGRMEGSDVTTPDNASSGALANRKRRDMERVDEIRPWLEACSPDEPIEQSDSRYVRLWSDSGPDAARPTGLRGRDPIAPLLDAIELRRAGSCQLFSGYLGTGKSTELKRLKWELEQRGSAVLYADAQRYHDLAHPITIQELLIVLAGAFGDAAKGLVGADFVREDYWTRFLAFLKTEVVVESAVLKLGIADVKMILKKGMPLWEKIADLLGNSLANLSKDVNAYVREVVEVIRRRTQCKRVVFLFDSLERLRGLEEGFHATMESIERLLTQHADFLRLPGCHVVYTVPPYVLLRGPEIGSRYDGRLRVLPAIKVLERGPEIRPFPPGIAAMADIVSRRLPIERVFGDHQLLEELIIASGGHVRTLMSFLRDLLTNAVRGTLPVTRGDVDEVINSFAEEARNAVRPEGVLLLDTIRRTTTLDAVKEADLGLLARYIDSYLVLCYQNGEGWFEVHPLIRDHIAKRAAQMAEEAAAPKQK